MFNSIGAFLVFVGLVVLFLYFQYRRFVKQVSLPGPKPIPFFGNLHKIFGQPSMWIVALGWLYKHGDVIQLFILNRRVVVIGGNEEAVKEVFVNKIYTKGKLGLRYADTGGKTGLVFSEGEIWSRVRGICNGVFNTQHLQMFVDPMCSSIEQLNKKLSENLSTLDKMRAIDMDEIFMLTTLDVIGSTMFSVDLQSLEKGGSELSKNVEIYLKEAFKQLVNPLQKLNPLCAIHRKQSAAFLVSFMQNLVEQRIKERSGPAGTHTTKDLLDLLLDAQHPDTGVGLTKEEIRDQVITFMIAGHETTAHTLTFAISHIARNPHIAEKLYEEIDQVVRSAPNNKISLDDAAKLHYLTAVIKETLRVNPIVPVILRELEEETLIANCMIPKGTAVAVNIIALHHNPKVWKNSTIFDPSRFISDDPISPEYKPSSFAFSPFGHGRRSCIGQHFAMLEAKLILASILHKFKFELLPMESVSPIQHLTFRPRGGLPVTVWKRE